MYTLITPSKITPSEITPSEIICVHPNYSKWNYSKWNYSSMRNVINTLSSLWLLMLLWIHYEYKKYLHIWFVWILQLHFASCPPAHQVCRAAGADTMGTSLCNYVQCSQQKENWILRPQLKTLQDILMLLIFCNFALQNVQFERQ